MVRTRIVVRGAVQGVGFRPFVHRLANELDLKGWVENTPQGVVIEVEGDSTDRFLTRLRTDLPSLAFIQSLEATQLDPLGFTGFDIRESTAKGETTALVMPDIATCPACVQEIFDPANRRYRYPFTNCTNCGPRFSIIAALPYDRRNTTMKEFVMCPACEREYRTPSDRRFHAQPNACPICGPRLQLWDRSGRVLVAENAALLGAVEEIRKGTIVAVKGLGGFHLMVDARNEDAARKLRTRKHREEKPLAVMVPTLDAARTLAILSAVEERLLDSPESPIVLVRRRAGTTDIAASVAPGNPTLGIMLPYTPIHHLLLKELGFPVVATSGNISDEPLCTDEQEALARLGGIADIFLVHNRPILRHVDDSIVRSALGRELVLRRARGFAPLPVRVGTSIEATLAVGAHLKSTVAVAKGENIFLSQHLGDLETEASLKAFQHEVVALQQLFDVQPRLVVSDSHPDYLSTAEADRTGLPRRRIQHHHAHVAACLAENEITGPALGVAWDGTGLGTDNTIWGGEFLRVDGGRCERVGSIRTFPLPGGDAAAREPRRVAIGLLYELMGEEVFRLSDVSPISSSTPEEIRVLRGMLLQQVNTPVTSSMGRLFDAVASILGIRQQSSFEGQAAMDLEFAQAEGMTAEPFPVVFDATGFRWDWGPMIMEILDGVRNSVPTGVLSSRFHKTLAVVIREVAKRVGLERVVLTGGCFQNVILTELAVTELRGAGFRPYWHQRVPPNDGGIALGQIVAGSAKA
jgi:hydrogenase maturation protein HypF